MYVFILATQTRKSVHLLNLLKTKGHLSLVEERNLNPVITIIAVKIIMY